MPLESRSFDFRRLLDKDFAERFVGPECIPDNELYAGRDGVRFHDGGPGREATQEVVRVTEDALLIACDEATSEASLHEQLVSDSDWVHFKFVLSGGDRECVSNTDVIDTPETSCVVVRYPKDSIVRRLIHAADTFRVACLMLTPKSLIRLLDAPPSSLPERTLWIAQQGPLKLQAAVLPLNTAMRVAVSEILSCPYRGLTRRSYMRGKSLELLASVIHTMDGCRGEQFHGPRLSSSDAKKLDRARGIMKQELENTMTLAELGRRVGMSRTRLALGFKKVYGVSVQAYWRDEKLFRARELIQRGEARVTDIALNLGYAGLSSFSRAFHRKFGQLPRAIKRNGP